MAGLSAAQVLKSRGRQPVVFEKSKGVGGRAATRRVDDIPVDHGAQFFTVRNGDFEAQVAAWQNAGFCFEWSRNIPLWKDGKLQPLDPRFEEPRYACHRGMTQLSKAMAIGVDVFTKTRVTRISIANRRVRLDIKDADPVYAESAILTAPAGQTHELIKDYPFPPHSMNLVDTIEYSPCLTVIAECKTSAPDWKGIHVKGEDISWIGDDSSKREKPPKDRRMFIIHATPEYSRENFDDPEKAHAQLIKKAKKITAGAVDHVKESTIQRWRYALTSRRIDTMDFLSISNDPPILLAGDAFLGPRMESAWLSGRDAGHYLLTKHL